MMKWIKNEVSYQEIAKNNTEEDLMAARHAVWYVEDEINGMVKSDEYDQNTMRKKFQEITGYKYNEIEKYIKDIRASQYKELTAAYDYKKSKQGTQGKTVGICDSYVTKFKYNKKQIELYNDVYGFGRLNLSSNEAKIIRKVWAIKLKASDDSELATRTDLYVAKDDSFETMMSYDKIEIDLYQNLFGKYPTPGGSSENGPMDGVMLEWTHMKEDGKHSTFYNKNFNGRSFVIPVVDGKKQYYDESDMRENKNKVTNSEVNELEEAELVNSDGITNDAALDEARENDTDANIDNKQYYYPKRDSDSTYASTTQVDDTIEKADEFTNEGSSQIDATELQNFSNMLYNALLIIGIIIAVIVGAILGIKFMMGSVGEKADIKKLLVPYVVGCIIVFGAFGIWKLVVTILANM